MNNNLIPRPLFFLSCIFLLLFAFTASIPLTGSFLQLDGSNLNWKEEDWKKELSYMKAIGMDTLIIGAGAFESYAFYPSRFLPLYQPCGTKDPVGTILSLAEKLKMDVYLGLFGWDWKDKGSEADFQKFAELNIKVAKELYHLYSSSPRFKGWYILTWEIGNAPPPDNVAVRAYLKVIANLRKLTPKKKIIIAPYFTLDVSPEEIENGWKRLLEVLDVDVVAFQDGVGCDRGIKPGDVPKYFEAMKRACDAHKVELWGDLEVFDILAGWKPAKIERVKEQIEKMSPFVRKIVIFEFNHYMSPLRGEEQRKLYNDYKKFLSLKR